MQRDPFTLVVALDKDKSSKGTLYLDDGETYDWKQGAYILQKFEFKDFKLNGSSLHRGTYLCVLVQCSPRLRLVFVAVSGSVANNGRPLPQCSD